MGDTIEFTTWPSPQVTFYPLPSSGALAFEIKGDTNANIRLATTNDRTMDDYMIIVSNGNSSMKKRQGGKVEEPEDEEEKPTPDIITPDRFQKFWITWYNKVIRFGRHGETDPILKLDRWIDGLKYVGFYTTIDENNDNPVHWRLQWAPSQVHKPIKMKNITGGSLHWLPLEPGGQLPDSALVGGFEDELLYICRLHYRNRDSITPRKFAPSKGCDYHVATYDQMEESSSHLMMVLCGFDCVWVKPSRNRIPFGAVEGGHVSSEILYVGRVEYKGYLIPGYVNPASQVIFAYKGEELGEEDNYEILVEPCAPSYVWNELTTGYQSSEASSSPRSSHSHSRSHSGSPDREARIRTPSPRNSRSHSNSGSPDREARIRTPSPNSA